MANAWHYLRMYFELLWLQVYVVVSRPWQFLVLTLAVVAINIGMPLAWLGIFDAFGGSIRGWAMRDYIGMFGVAMLVFGVVNLFTNGIRDLPRLVKNGGFARMLLRPLPLISQLSANRLDATTPIDVGLGVIVLGWYCATTPLDAARVGLFALAMLSAAVLLWCFGVMLPNLLPFYIRGSNQLSIYLSYFIQDSTSSPSGVLVGPWRWFFLVGVPGLLIAPVPLRVLSDFEWREAVLGMFVAVFWQTVTLWLFKVSVRRFRRGKYL